MLLAGHETTATTISWALYYIARDAALQQVCFMLFFRFSCLMARVAKRLQAEVDAALRNKDASPDGKAMTIAILNHLPLIKATMFEALVRM